jgi:hypothetical protein
MRARLIASAALAGALALAVVVALVADGSSSGPPARGDTGGKSPAVETQPTGVRVGCGRRSGASFPGAYTSPRNLVLGPLALVGAGEATPAEVVREFGGNKFPLLVKAGHTVTIRIRGGARRFAGLAYGGLGRRPLPQGEIRHRHAAHTMTFVACRRRGPVTFWSGFVVMRRPGCVRLDVYVDRDPSPRPAVIDMGSGRCG